MEITEKDLEDLIFDDLSGGGRSLQRRGFQCSLINEPYPNKVFWYRQVPLKGYGIADIIGFTRYWGMIHVALIELKNVPITEKDFEQLFRYREGIKTICPGTLIEFKYTLTGFEFNAFNGGWHRTDCKQMHLRDIKCSQELIIPAIPSIHLTSERNGQEVH